jgi:hypothetical protein
MVEDKIIFEDNDATANGGITTGAVAVLDKKDDVDKEEDVLETLNKDGDEEDNPTDDITAEDVTESEVSPVPINYSLFLFFTFLNITYTDYALSLIQCE